tara:strand:+ start:5026 stop:5301 length:276 start_codon:yes stop_codon:yes gene_type:complete
MSKSYVDREQDRFKETDKGETAVRVISVRGADGGGFAPQLGVDYDVISATYPTTSTELYTYSLSGQDQFTMTVTYTDASKELITSVVYSAI